MTTEVAPSTFRAGDRVAVTLTVRNAASRTRSIAPNSCEDPFTVTATDGTVFPPASWVCAAIFQPPREIPAGGVAVFMHEWRGGVGPGSSGGLETLLSPGTYSLVGFVRASDGTKVVARAPVPIQVLAR